MPMLTESNGVPTPLRPCSYIQFVMLYLLSLYRFAFKCCHYLVSHLSNKVTQMLNCYPLSTAPDCMSVARRNKMDFLALVLLALNRLTLATEGSINSIGIKPLLRTLAMTAGHETNGNQ